jgi:polar amino acid transport system substrate-binding protein
LLQVIQYQKTGEMFVEELPSPRLLPGGIVVRNVFSLISSGTERTSVETAQASIIGKARSRPDLVRQVIDNYKREGLIATYRKVQNRLDNYKDLGYSSAGVVVESACDDLAPGDRVACAGAGFAAHAEFVSVPRNLAARIPAEVGFDEATFTTVGSIALQGVRQADLHIGERIVVIGLGLVGLLTVQILKASGCLVFGLDISSRNLELAERLDCDEVAISGRSALPGVERFTKGYGADAVIITAASKSNEPFEFATECCRKKGRVVVVGAVGMDIPRFPAYEKELDFRMSCSYGPGRYHAEYETQGLDYPHAYVRWTENRNMEAVLDLVARKKLDVRSLVTHTFPIEDALKAYNLITGKSDAWYLGVLISYPQNKHAKPAQKLELKVNAGPTNALCTVGIIGAGNHAQSYLLPFLRDQGAVFQVVATSKPVNAKSAAKKFGFRVCTTDAAEVFCDPGVNLVLIGSRHDSHAQYVIGALRAGKHVFVEKPLAITPEQLDEIIAAHNDAVAPFIMVGYNRRFSKPIKMLQSFFAGPSEPLTLIYRVNAGFLPGVSWYQDPSQGGRVLGEIGHFLDTLQFLAGAPVTSVYTLAPADCSKRYRDDNVQISLTFHNGSVGHITYVASGASSMPKEYIEVFSGGKSAVLDNFQRLLLFDGRNRKSHKFKGYKGHREEMNALLAAVRSGQPPVTMASLVATSQASFAVLESLRNRTPVFIS